MGHLLSAMIIIGTLGIFLPPLLDDSARSEALYLDGERVYCFNGVMQTYYGKYTPIWDPDSTVLTCAEFEERSNVK